MAKTSRWSITVLGGPLRGTRFDAPPGTEEVLIGAEPGCDLFLDLPGVSPIHARIAFVGAGFVIRDAGSRRGVFVNDRHVEGEGPLQDEDLLWLGPPGEEESVLLKVRLPRDVGELAMGERERAPASIPLFAPEPTTEGDADLDLPPLGPAPDVVVDSEPTEPMGAEEPGSPAAGPARPGGGAEEFDISSWASSAPSHDEPSAGEAPGEPAAAAFEIPPVEDDAFEEPVAGGPPAPPEPERAESGSRSGPEPPRPPAAPGPAPTKEPEPRSAARSPAAKQEPLSAADAWLAGLDEVPRTAPAPPTPKVPARVSDPSGRPARRRSPLRSALPFVAGIAVLGVATSGFVAWRALGTPRVVAISPDRAQPGDTVVLSGSRFAADPAALRVRFGDEETSARSATAERVEVVVPELPTQPGQDTTLSVVLVSGGRAARPVSLSVFRPPDLQRLEPDYGLAGDELDVVGTGWGEAPRVRFGETDAVVLEATPERLRIRVPELEAAAGEAVPVSVWAGANGSKPTPFIVGRPPLLVAVDPAQAMPGAELTLRGRGFAAAARDNLVRVGGARGLVVSAGADTLQVVVPHVPAGAPQVLELRVGGAAALTRALALEPAPPFALVAQPFGTEAPEEQAALATAFGPLIVLRAAGGQSAAARALRVQRAWQAGGVPEARGLDGDRPTLALAGARDSLLEVAPEDVRGYSDAARRRDPPLTAARLALWWEGLLLDVRRLEAGQAAGVAAGLAPEGQLLGQLSGTPSASLARRLEAFASRLPAAVPASRASAAGDTSAAPVASAATTPGAAPGGAAEPAAAPGPLVLEGAWKGREDERGAVKFMTVIFDGTSGRLVYGGGVQVSTPFRQFDRRGSDEIHFAIEHGRGGLRHYRGRWDGQKIAGTIADAAGKALGTFELRR